MTLSMWMFRFDAAVFNRIIYQSREIADPPAIGFESIVCHLPLRRSGLPDLNQTMNKVDFGLRYQIQILLT